MTMGRSLWIEDKCGVEKLYHWADINLFYTNAETLDINIRDVTAIVIVLTSARLFMAI